MRDNGFHAAGEQIEHKAGTGRRLDAGGGDNRRFGIHGGGHWHSSRLPLVGALVPARYQLLYIVRVMTHAKALRQSFASKAGWRRFFRILCDVARLRHSEKAVVEDLRAGPADRFVHARFSKRRVQSAQMFEDHAQLWETWREYCRCVGDAKQIRRDAAATMRFARRRSPTLMLWQMGFAGTASTTMSP